MSIHIDLKYLGLNKDEIEYLRKLCKDSHIKTGLSVGLCHGCYSNGTGVRSTMENILEKLIEAGKHARLERPIRRDQSICNHTHGGTLRLWEYEGKTLCEICSKEV